VKKVIVAICLVFFVVIPVFSQMKIVTPVFNNGIPVFTNPDLLMQVVFDVRRGDFESVEKCKIDGTAKVVPNGVPLAVTGRSFGNVLEVVIKGERGVWYVYNHWVK
jgi:hypothetical protein